MEYETVRNLVKERLEIDRYCSLSPLPHQSLELADGLMLASTPTESKV